MTDTGEKKYIKKKIRPGDIALDEHDPALVVQYELEGALFAPDGITVITELSAGRKRIKVKRMDSRTDLNALANEIVTGCKLIHSSKVGKVEALLVALRDRGMGTDKNQKKNETKQELVRESNSNASSRAASRIEPATAQSARQSAQPTGTGRTNRALNVGTTGTKNTTRTSTKKPDDHYQKTLHTLKQNEEKRLLAEARGDFLGCLEASSALSEGLVSSGASRNGLVSGIGTSLQSLAGGVSSHGKARVEDIDLYLQKLYDDDVAVKGLFCGKIASLAQRVENLTTLVEHPTLPQTLARVLREEGRHSHEVSYGILSVFFALSNVKAFHRVLTENQIGDATLRVVDLELARFKDRVRMLRIENGLGNGFSLDWEALCLDTFEQRRLLLSEQKRDKLLYVALYTLLNVSENTNVERKMKKRNVCEYLMQTLGRSDVGLLTLAVTFLRKLSVRKENVEVMLRSDPNATSGTGGDDASNIVDRLSRFLLADGTVPDVLVSQTLRLLRNLSHHHQCRATMFTRNLLPRLVAFAKTREHADAAWGLLYHLSVDRSTRPFFAYTEVVGLICASAKETGQVAEAPTLAGVFVNLSCDAKCAEAFVRLDEKKTFVKLDDDTITKQGVTKPFRDFCARSVLTGDPLGVKVLRNAARFCGDATNAPGVSAFFADPDFQRTTIDTFLAEPCGSHVHLELLGVLGDIQRPDLGLDISGTCKQSDLFAKVVACLAPSDDDDNDFDDVALEAVHFVCAFSHDESNVLTLVTLGVVPALYELLRRKKDDDAFVLAIVDCFAKLFAFDVSRSEVLENTQTVFYLVELLKDESPVIANAADSALDVVYDFDEQWAVKIRRMRFEAHNKQWLDAVDGHGLLDHDGFGDGGLRRDGRDDSYDSGEDRSYDRQGQLLYDDPNQLYDDDHPDQYGYDEDDARGGGMYD